MNLEPTELYMKDNKGAIRVWSIEVRDYNIIIHHGLLNGALQTQFESVPVGKAGRSRREQVMSRVASRIHKRRDMGYSPDIQRADERPKNALNLPKPMLAQPIKNVKNIDFKNAYAQIKYDGNRALIANTSKGKVAYTRNGKIITTINHILDDIDMPDNAIIDGELYADGQSLQTIVSWVKRLQDNSLKLKYHAYDIISNKPYSERISMLNDISYGSHSKFVRTIPIKSMDEINLFFRVTRNAGHEGAILRWGTFGYEDGKRSKSLVKIKETIDQEFQVVDIKESADGWAVLTCIGPRGVLFGVSAPGCMQEKRKPIQSPADYLGRYVRVEYMYLTKEGVPFHPVATTWLEPKDK